jgi:hypothetical protein
MNNSANVTSIEAVHHFRLAVKRFEEDASNAVLSLQTELMRTAEWLEHEQAPYWKEEVRRGFDRVSQARSEYETCRMRTIAGHHPACDEQKDALAKAKLRLRIAQEKVEKVREWKIKLGHESEEFKGRVSQLQHCLEESLPRLDGVLERMVDSLESYVGKAVTKPEVSSSEETTSETSADVVDGQGKQQS